MLRIDMLLRECVCCRRRVARYNNYIFIFSSYSSFIFCVVVALEPCVVRGRIATCTTLSSLRILFPYLNGHLFSCVVMAVSSWHVCDSPAQVAGIKTLSYFYIFLFYVWFNSLFLSGCLFSYVLTVVARALCYWKCSHLIFASTLYSILCHMYNSSSFFFCIPHYPLLMPC